MSDQPLVSFILGVYNTKSFDDLKRSMDNMLNQTYGNIEVVVCDDCSTNGTYEFLLENYGDDERVVLLRNETNLKLGRTLNRCLEVARGVYIARQDDDDYSAPDRIEQQLAILESHPEYALVSTELAKFDKDGVWHTVHLKECPDKRDFCRYSQHAHPSTLFRAETLRAVGGYRIAKETARAEDYDLFMRIYAAGMRGYNIKQALYYYNYPRRNKRKLPYRYKYYEAVVRAKGFRAMRLPLGCYIHVLRPLVAGLMGEGLKQRIKSLIKES